jgi:hypothetical protein
MRHTLTGWGYTSGCRCTTCTAAQRAHGNQIRNRRRALRTLVNGRLVAPTEHNGWPVEHGTKSTYQNWMCRCEPCTAAASDKYAQWRNRKLAKENAK